VVAFVAKLWWHWRAHRGETAPVAAGDKALSKKK
jgi:hypothetical protein